MTPTDQRTKTAHEGHNAGARAHSIDKKEAQWQDMGTLGVLAHGSIAPTNESAQTREPAFLTALELCYESIPEQLIASCIDGRRSLSDEEAALNPNAAGGSLALWVAARLSGLDLTLESFLTALSAAGLPLGGHSDEHACTSASGCGANDKLRHILGILGSASTADFLYATADHLGDTLDPGARRRILLKAAELALLDERGGLGGATERLALLARFGTAPLLVGGHTEQLVILNQVEGSTLNRQALFETLGAHSAVFNVDLWATQSSAQATAKALALQGLSTDYDPATFCTALLFYNLGTALTLCTPDMPVVQRLPK